MLKSAGIAPIPSSRPALPVHGNAACGTVSEFTRSCKNPRNALENPSARVLLLLLPAAQQQQCPFCLGQRNSDWECAGVSGVPWAPLLGAGSPWHR